MSVNKHATDKSQPHYLSLKQAQALGYGCPEVLRRRIKDGLLPDRDLGGGKKVTIVELEAMVRAKNEHRLARAKDPTAAAAQERQGAVDQIIAVAPSLSDEQVRVLRDALPDTEAA